MLNIDRLSRSFGGVAALDDLDLAVGDGEVVGLIGPNGSGKTTLFNVITGVHAADSGRVLLRGEDVTGATPARIIRRGVARTFQNLRIFRRMSVHDNVWVAQHSLPEVGHMGLLSTRSGAERARRAEVEHLLHAVGLADRRDALAGSLPLPDQRRLELARALARSPALLLLDEPAGGMTPAETAQMAELIRTFAVPGRTCIVIEHKLDLISALCRRLCVLNFGRKIADGVPGKRSCSNPTCSKPISGGIRSMLEVRDLHVSYGKVRAVQGVSLEVEEGEIVALIGANGAGKSTTMHAVCGIERPAAGQIRFYGTRYCPLAAAPDHAPRNRAGAGGTS